MDRERRKTAHISAVVLRWHSGELRPCGGGAPGVLALRYIHVPVGCQLLVKLCLERCSEVPYAFDAEICEMNRASPLPNETPLSRGIRDD